MVRRRQRRPSSQLHGEKPALFLFSCIAISCFLILEWKLWWRILYVTKAVNDQKKVTSALPPLGILPILTAETITEDPKETMEEIYFNISYSMFEVPMKDWSYTTTKDPSLSSSSFFVDLKIYVYDNLPRKLTTSVEECLLDLYLHTIDHVENFKAELGLIGLFRSCPQRTQNPNEADFFVVPYAAEGHCQCHEGYSWNCAQVPPEDMDDLRSGLWFLNETTKKRHVFVLAGATAKPQLWSKPLKLTTAPSKSRGQIVIPNLEDKAPYQPTAILNRGIDWWTKRERRYAFSFLYGGRNPKMKGGGRKYRDYLEQNIADRYPSNTMRSMPFLMRRWASPHDFHKVETFRVYNQSIFCPCLPGDLAWQKRFFDVVLNGCLPVVLAFQTPNRSKSWFLPDSPDTVTQTYPFAKGAFDGDDAIEIDYESFVVEVPITDETNMTGVLLAMEAILSDPDELRRRQLNMMQHAIHFTYGMGPDAHRHDDAFARILRALQHYQSLLNQAESI